MWTEYTVCLTEGSEHTCTCCVIIYEVLSISGFMLESKKHVGP